MKRSASDDDLRDDDRGSKRHHGGGGSRSEIRMLVPSRNAGAVIGKGGSNIKRLRQDFHATIILPDTNSPERLMIIAGPPDVICEVLTDVIPILEERRGGGDNEESEIRFLIHQSQAGAIIGRGGNKVKELREDTGAHIKVYTECAPLSTERIVQVNGSPRVIVKCVESIMNVVESSPVKGTSRQYDPMNWDEGFINEYGGYPGRSGDSMGGGRSGGGRGSRMGGFGDRRSDMRGGRDDYDRDRERDRDRSRDRDGGRRRSGGYDRGYDRGGYGGRDGGGMFRDQLTTSQVSVPKDLAGLIIGRNGGRIKEIRQQSGANITIDDPAEGQADRIITIIGSSEQIHTAQYLLQTTVKQRVR